MSKSIHLSVVFFPLPLRRSWINSRVFVFPWHSGTNCTWLSQYELGVKRNFPQNTVESKLTLRPLLLLHTQSSPAGEGGDMRNIFQIYKNKWNIHVERQSTLKPYPCQRFVLLAQMKIILHVTVLLNCMSQSVISGVSMGTDGGRTVTVNTRRWLVPGPCFFFWDFFTEGLMSSLTYH